MILLPGVYKFTSEAQLTGTLTLNANGDPDAEWVFQVGAKTYRHMYHNNRHNYTQLYTIIHIYTPYTAYTHYNTYNAYILSYSRW
jgi:hypothetical protein